MKDVLPEKGICWDSVIETELTGKKQPDWLMKGDILFAARGARNYAVMIDQNRGQIISAPYFYILRAKVQALLPEFLVWQLNQKPLQNYFNSAAEGTLTKSVRRSILEKTEITVLPIEKQRQILGLHETLLREKKLYAELIRNADKLLNAIASDLVADKTL
jgi:restriction endonuclease S subunit